MYSLIVKRACKIFEESKSLRALSAALIKLMPEMLANCSINTGTTLLLKTIIN